MMASYHYGRAISCGLNPCEETKVNGSLLCCCSMSPSRWACFLLEQAHRHLGGYWPTCVTLTCQHLLTWVATSPEFNDKTLYTTLGRTLGPFNKMGTFLVEVFEQYNWRKVVVISSTYFIWAEAGAAFRKVFRCSSTFLSFSYKIDGLHLRILMWLRLGTRGKE